MTQEQKEELVRQIAWVAWKGAANAFRMYPDNKHTFTEYWHGSKPAFNDYVNQIAQPESPADSIGKTMRWVKASERMPTPAVHLKKISAKYKGDPFIIIYIGNEENKWCWCEHTMIRRFVGHRRITNEELVDTEWLDESQSDSTGEQEADELWNTVYLLIDGWDKSGSVLKDKLKQQYLIQRRKP